MSVGGDDWEKPGATALCGEAVDLADAEGTGDVVGRDWRDVRKEA